jgi:ketosteroid isomerase-like protein
MPASADSEAEKSILAEIEGMNEAQKAMDLDRVLSFVADDANMKSFATGRPQTKAEYRAAVKRRMEDPRFREMKMQFQAVKMDFTDLTHITVRLEQKSWVRSTFTNPTQGWDELQRLEWKFEKRGTRWLIVEQTWLK